MEDGKLTTAADECLRVSMDTERPFAHIAHYVANLRANPNWTDADVIEVQSRLIRTLLKRFEDRGK
jgi:hypothetical protein